MDFNGMIDVFDEKISSATAKQKEVSVEVENLISEMKEQKLPHKEIVKRLEMLQLGNQEALSDMRYFRRRTAPAAEASEAESTDAVADTNLATHRA